MSSDLSAKVQNALWWITSIATSVVCCSVIFVLFASYFVDVRDDIRSGNMRMNMIEEREDRILAEIEAIRKHGVGGEVAAAPTLVPATVTTVPIETPAPAQGQVPAPASVEITTPAPTTTLVPAPDNTPAVTPMPTPSPGATPPAPASVPVITSPPMAPATSDKP